jgi:Mn-dependent DtxR family transcriptional regulator
MATSPPQRFTELQGQYLAFIHAYTLVNGRPPAEADMQRFFGVTPPSVHSMVIGLERHGLIARVAGQPRSITVTVSDDDLPRLRQPIKTAVAGY